MWSFKLLKGNLNIVTAATVAALVLATMWLIFFWAPTDVAQGAIQRIVYVHVPLAWGAMVAMVFVAAISIVYLRTGNKKWDLLAIAGAEVGVVFGLLMLFSGMVWARPVWGVWWTGEAKLTTALIMVLIFVAYLMFRAYLPPGKRHERIAAVIAIIGALDTPIVYFAAQLWEQSHPPLIIGPAASNDAFFDARFGIVLLVSTIAFSLVLIQLIYERYRTKVNEEATSHLLTHWRDA